MGRVRDCLKLVTGFNLVDPRQGNKHHRTRSWRELKAQTGGVERSDRYLLANDENVRVDH